MLGRDKIAASSVAWITRTGRDWPVVTEHEGGMVVLLEPNFRTAIGRVEIVVAVGVISGGEFGFGAGVSCGKGGEEICLIAKLGVVS